jgi:hypothetical protein
MDLKSEVMFEFMPIIWQYKTGSVERLRPIFPSTYITQAK